MQISDKTFLTVISLLILIAILSTAYIFLMKKDYDFIIEVPCDPASAVCFVRDCSGGECPPNELEQYRVFAVSAADFASCAEDTCARACTTGTIACTEFFCGESEEDECTK